MVADYSAYSFWLTKSSSISDAKVLLRQFYAFVLNGIDLRYKSVTGSCFTITVLFAGLYIAQTPSDSLWTESRKVASGSVYQVTATAALDDFRTWIQSTPNLPGHDHAMLFTAYDLEANGNNAVAGLAYTEAACTTNSQSIVEDNFDAQLMTIAAHELGHGLGASHDGTLDGTGDLCLPTQAFIMSASVTLSNLGTYGFQNNKNLWKFSSCSLSYLQRYINTLNSTNCLTTLSVGYNSTALSPYDQQNPGQIYSADIQCRYKQGNDSYLYRSIYRGNYTNVCSAFYCQISGSIYCSLGIAAERTTSGDGKWCVAGECVTATEAPSVNDTCPFGDQPGIVGKGLTCTQLVANSSFNCYNYAGSCCVSCQNVYTGIIGCEYGEIAVGCIANNCEFYDNTSLAYCCKTCYVQPTTITTARTSTTTTASTNTITITPTTTSTTTVRTTTTTAASTSSTLAPTTTQTADSITTTTSAFHKATNTTAEPSPSSTTAAPTSTSTTAIPTPSSTTAAPTSTKTTAAPTPSSTTAAVPTASSTITAPIPSSTTAAPTPSSTTAAPTSTTTTVVPTQSSTTAALSPSSTTAAPNPTTTTAAPTPSSTTAAPTSSSTTAAPTLSSTTAAPFPSLTTNTLTPSLRTTTKTPSSTAPIPSSTTAAPTPSSTTAAPTSTTTTVVTTPSLTTAALSPSSTTSAPTSTTTTAAPTPSSTTAAPTPSSTTAAPTPSSTTSAPTPGSTTSAQTPSSTTAVPTQTTSTASPTPTTSTSAPNLSSTTAAQAPTTTTAAPKSTTRTAAPTPSSTTTAPTPSSTRAVPTQTTSTASPIPTITTAAPTPTTTTPAPNSTTTTAAPTPSSTTKAPTPSSTTAAPIPSSTTAAPSPSSTTAAPTPSSTTASPTSTTTTVAPTLSSTTAAPTPTTTTAAPTPSSTTAAPPPSSTTAAPTPTTTKVAPTPGPSTAAPTPNSTTAAPTPSSTAAVPTPTATTAAPTPTVSNTITSLPTTSMTATPTTNTTTMTMTTTEQQGTKKTAVTVRLNYNRSSADNLSDSSTYARYVDIVGESLREYYTRKVGKDVQINIRDIRRGSLIVQYELVIINTPIAQIALAKANIDLAAGENITVGGQVSGVESMVVENKTVPIGNGSKDHLCTVYIIISGGCPDNYKCVVFNSSPLCQPITTTMDIVPVTVAAAVAGFVIVVAVVALICSLQQRFKNRDKHMAEPSNDSRSESEMTFTQPSYFIEGLPKQESSNGQYPKVFAHAHKWYPGYGHSNKSFDGWSGELNSHHYYMDLEH